MSRPHLDNFSDLAPGDMVHFVEYINGTPKCWPALIVEKLGVDIEICNLKVTTKNSADYHVPQVPHDTHPNEPNHGTWHTLCCCGIEVEFVDHFLHNPKVGH